MPPRKYVCPKCQQKAGVNIGYGYPGIEQFEQAERQEIVLGGCIWVENQPERHCISCEHEWRIVRRSPPSFDPLDDPGSSFA